MVSTAAIAGVANYLVFSGQVTFPCYGVTDPQLVRRQSRNHYSVLKRKRYSVPIYNVSDPRYAWLEQDKYLSHGAVEGDKIKISQYRVQHPHRLAQLITRVNAIRGRPGAADK
jgi:hypothetical protein